MSKVRVCDICGEPLTFRHYKHCKIKRMYDGYVTDKNKIDICNVCWHYMEDYIKLKEEENGR